MIRVLMACGVTLSLAWAVPPASAISPTCLPGGFPERPGTDVVSQVVAWGPSGPQQQYRVEVWRVKCQDDSGEVAVLLRATPITPAAFVCSDNVALIQSRAQIPAALRQVAEDPAFCGDLLVATTFSLERQSGPAFEPTGAFTLSIDQGPDRATLEIPAGGGKPALGITVVSTGCNPCRAGQVAAFHVRTVNPGMPLEVELRAGIRFPDNSPALALSERCIRGVLPTGEETITLTVIVVPVTARPGTYTIEAALLDPVFGTTLARHSMTAVKQ